ASWPASARRSSPRGASGRRCELDRQKDWGCSAHGRAAPVGQGGAGAWPCHLAFLEYLRSPVHYPADVAPPGFHRVTNAWEVLTLRCEMTNMSRFLLSVLDEWDGKETTTDLPSGAQAVASLTSSSCNWAWRSAGLWADGARFGSNAS